VVLENIHIPTPRRVIGNSNGRESQKPKLLKQYPVGWGGGGGAQT